MFRHVDFENGFTAAAYFQDGSTMAKPTSDPASDNRGIEPITGSPICMIERTDIQRLSMFVSAILILTISVKWFMSSGDGKSPMTGSVPTDSPTGFKVDLNRSSADELSLLPQVGPKLAASIVREREQNGNFLTIDDLDRAPGVGPQRVAQLEPFLEITD
jgi:competence ComEA-like helix-hairpin-helix protein